MNDQMFNRKYAVSIISFRQDYSAACDVRNIQEDASNMPI